MSTSASMSETHPTNDLPAMPAIEPAPSASSSDFGSCSSDAPGFVVEIGNLDAETEAEDLIDLCQDFGTVVGVSVEQDVIRVALTAKVTFSSEAEARTAAMALDNQEADGRTLEASYGGANNILKTILPDTATEQYAGHLSDRPPLPPVPSTGSSFKANATPFSLSHTSENEQSVPRVELEELNASLPAEAEDVKEETISEAGWSSPASTFAPSEASRASSENPTSPAQIDADAADKPELQALSKDQDLSGDAWLAGETIKTPTKADTADIHEQSEEKSPEQHRSPKLNIAAPSFTPLSLSVSSSENAGKEAEGKADDSGVWLLESPKSKAIPIHPAPKPAVASSPAKPSPHVKESIDASAGKGGFVSAQSLRESRSPPTSPTLSEASTTTVPRHSPLKSSARAFVPSSYPESTAAAFWAGQAMAMAQYGMPPVGFLQQQGYMPTLMVQNNLNPQSTTYQPGSYGTALASRTDLNIGASPFVPSASSFDKKPFPCDLESYSDLFAKAGVESMADLKEMLDTPELVSEFVDDLRKEYPNDLTTFKTAFKLKVQLKRSLELQ